MLASVRSIIKAIEVRRCFHVAITGDYWKFKHPSLPGRVTVPQPKRHTLIWMLRSIEKQPASH